MDQIAKFYEELSGHMKSFSGGVEAIANATGISKVTLWRWINGINLKYPDPLRVLKILQYLSHKKNISELKSYFGGAIQTYLEQYTSEQEKGNTEICLDDFGRDYYTFLIFFLVGNYKGASAQELIETCGRIIAKKNGIEEASAQLINEMGKFVLEKLGKLENEGIVIKKEDRYFRKMENISLPLDTETTLKYFAENLVNFTEPNKFPQGGNSFYTFTESIPLQLARELARDTKEFYLNCVEKMKNAKCKSGVHYQILASAEKIEFNLNLEKGVL